VARGKGDLVTGGVILDDVTKIFRDGTVAVRSITLEVDPGQFFVFLGPSGCGKTTLLRTVAGLEEATYGRIFIGGRDVTETSPKDRDVAMVFQNYALYPHMTVYDNLAFSVQMRRLKKKEIDRRVRRAAQILELEEQLRKRPRALSGGQQQRVAMGRAIVREPEVFLMDEPMSNLDARLRVQTRGEIARIQREVGITTLYVTHDQTEALTLGDRIAVLKDGVLQQVAAPTELYRAPKSLFVAGFVGSPPMNLAEATVEEEAGLLYVRFGGHRLRADGAGGAPMPKLRAHAGGQVIVGVRPEDLDDPVSLGVATDSRLRVEVERRETIGPDVFLHFRVEAPLLLLDDPREAGVDGATGPWPAERSNLWMSRLPSSGARVGDQVELAVRPGRLHVFDPRTGETLGDET
jgi:multiple sugar transport system ATP-binding protein